ncbi:hypothetical protein N1851_023525 [Merluccius polli]|uniref:Uncharacterized protein n=1 Tax=Merluccius polli TaxID=89951 RepID=A0AA47MGB4_MERPO|nr:hypothetical protein N1851_023525 [Merluccius polli]
MATGKRRSTFFTNHELEILMCSYGEFQHVFRKNTATSNGGRGALATILEGQWLRESLEGAHPLSPPPKTSLMALTGLCPGKTTNMGKSRFMARHTFLTALHTVALLKCSASPTLYKKLPFAKKHSATHNILLGCESMTMVGNVANVRTD